jgi:hypothetical protein
MEGIEGAEGTIEKSAKVESTKSWREVRPKKVSWLGKDEKPRRRNFDDGSKSEDVGR